MEPMALGSPGARPATNPYFPSFLLDDQQTPTAPRNNTLSPKKTGVRNLSFGFGISPGTALPTSPQDYNRSPLSQKTLFGGYQQAPPAQQNAINYPGTPVQSHNASVSGPPTQGLFDSLGHKRYQVLTPTRSLETQSHLAANNMSQFNSSVASAYGMNPNLSSQQSDSYVNTYSLNVSRARAMSPLMPGTPNPNMQGANNSKMFQSSPQTGYTEFWVTVFGFPPSATTIILQHFALCGMIVDKAFPMQNGNWIHLKYSSRLECEKALNYNGKILASNIMVGVTQCKEKYVINKESICKTDRVLGSPKIRSLVQTPYQNQTDTTCMVGSTEPQKTSGLMNKALDLLFGW